MGFQFIRWIVTINRPEVLNSLHPPACRELDEAFNEFSADPEAWVGILTAAGNKAFCAGNDLKWQAEHGGEAVREGLKNLKGGFGGITARFSLLLLMALHLAGDLSLHLHVTLFWLQIVLFLDCLNHA